MTPEQQAQVNKKIEEIAQITGMMPALILFTETEFSVVLGDGVEVGHILGAARTMSEEDPKSDSTIPPYQ